MLFMTLAARILKDDPQEYGIKLLLMFDDEKQYRKKWFASEIEMNKALQRAITSVPVTELISFTSAGLHSNGRKDIEPPGKVGEWQRFSQ